MVSGVGYKQTYFEQAEETAGIGTGYVHSYQMFDLTCGDVESSASGKTADQGVRKKNCDETETQ